nr:hypothetical protein [Candidatus Sigynarchaeota archaeon]
MKHDRSCRLRSFPTTCKFCGQKLLYWECTHGCKVMFEFDKFGRLAGHHKCHGAASGVRSSRPLKKRPPALAESGFDISSVSKKFIENLFKESFQCPVCKEKFASEASYYQHLHQKKAIDDNHSAFYRNNGQIIENLDITPPGEETVGSEPPVAPAASPASLKPDKVTVFPGKSSTINMFGGIRFKGKDGQSRMVKSYEDWWGEFTGGEGESCKKTDA